MPTVAEIIAATGTVADSLGKGLEAGGNAAGDETALAVGKGLSSSGASLKEDVAVATGADKAEATLTSIPTWFKWGLGAALILRLARGGGK